MIDEIPHRRGKASWRKVAYSQDVGPNFCSLNELREIREGCANDYDEGEATEADLDIFHSSGMSDVAMLSCS